MGHTVHVLSGAPHPDDVGTDIHREGDEAIIVERIPTRRLCDEGPRMELPVSVPSPTVPRLALTAAAVPPLEPAVTRFKA